MTIDNKVLKTVIPFIGSALILCGFIKISLFYNHFNIKIVYYLEFSEILTLFLPDILKYGLMMLVAIFFSFLFDSREQSIKVKNLQEKIYYSKKFGKRLLSHYKLFSDLYIISLLIILKDVIFFIWFRDKFLSSFNTTYFIYVFAVFGFLLFEFKYRYIDIYEKKFNPNL